MTPAQPGILEPIPMHARHLIFTHRADGNLKACLRQLETLADGHGVVVGFGQSLLQSLGCNIRGMQETPVFSGTALEVPATSGSLWVWLRGNERGDLVVQTRELSEALASVFELSEVIDCFKYRECRDLSGYEDGTENPVGEAALTAGFVDSETEGLNGSSFVAIQKWLHNLRHFKSLPQSEQDNIMGRRLSDNEEFEDAPESSHVKRSAQESFAPEAFMLRRSMPWSEAQQEGLMFVAFGHSFQAFDAIMKRMIGQDDGITDGLFRFTQPVTGAYFWCPPMKDKQLDLSQLKLA